MKTVIGNWKSNKNEKEALEWLEIVGPKLGKINNLDVSLAPQFPVLSLLKKEIDQKQYPLTLSAQDVGPFDEGAYTGEVSAKILADLVKYVLIGHSERRKNFNETDEMVVQKTKMAVKYGLIPIVCLPDLEVLKEIKNFSKDDLKRVIFMYEPPEAISKPIGPIGVGTAASIIEVLRMIKQIKNLTPKSKIFYGGSVKSNNVKIYVQEAEIDGVVIGSASLNPQEFLKIIKNASQF